MIQEKKGGNEKWVRRDEGKKTKLSNRKDWEDRRKQKQETRSKDSKEDGKTEEGRKNKG
jgi:hypothetical protein